MIKFLEEKHLYSGKDGKMYTSVTSILKRFEVKKDWEKIKKNYAKKNKLTVEEVTQKWEGARDKACGRGVAYHKFRELELVASDSMPLYGKDLLVVPSYCVSGEKFSKENMSLTEGIYPEIILWLESASIAGQADKVIICDGFVHIQDYKTNKEIKREGWRNWEGKEEKLLYPLDHLGNCNFNLYSLQLSMYMYIILRNNPKLRAGKMEILHVVFEKDQEDEYVREVIKMPVPYLSTEIANIINIIKKNASKTV